ncbi:efflux RND transporter periplasmic adaptor subunit [Nitrospirillum amazonense]|uniref:efflux RND transporter periplasmic adaptor subunit n=1 Tax=Nitrospirillum amazonense TaxID=28077 RepID=UPI002DD4306A|nr:efflux RND transporter periplasmic adaptor subunit [Nitrospirillum amazonense]MEC4593883.1 efflux RND transporter periplasmic adaptor subunit [Nitrospirillum amazonense]
MGAPGSSSAEGSVGGVHIVKATGVGGTGGMGIGMDRRVEKPKGWKGWVHRARTDRRAWAAGVALLALTGGAVVLTQTQGGQTVRVAESRLTVATVSQGTFEDFIPVRGAVEPLNSVYLDSIEGGRVEKKLVEVGQKVKAGQPLVELSNTQLQLDIISREAQVMEQINRLHDTELQLETNRISNQRELAECDYNVSWLSKDLERKTALIKTGASSQRDIDIIRDQIKWYERRRDLTLETMRTTDKMRASQYTEMQDSTRRLEENLAMARKNLDSLVVRAPVDGQITVLDVEIGQTKQKGERLGRIDRDDGFKVQAQMDEFYLSRLELGQTAEAAIGTGEYKLKVAKIYPQVRDGQFQVDLEFLGAAPQDIRSGQTLQMRLKLGAATTALLIPNGGFYQDTGGDWIFVVQPGGAYAEKRRVHLGRRNAQMIEVRDGLAAGDRVIVSSYGDLARMDRIELN